MMLELGGGGIGLGPLEPDPTAIFVGTPASGPPTNPDTGEPACNVYISTDIPNVVPVRFVTIREAGVVLARIDDTHAAGTFAVREAPAEVPYVPMYLMA